MTKRNQDGSTVASQVLWEYEESGNWNPFDPKLNKEVEAAYLRGCILGHTTVRRIFRNPKTKTDTTYSYNLSTMVQTNKATKYLRNIRRCCPSWEYEEEAGVWEPFSPEAKKAAEHAHSAGRTTASSKFHNPRSGTDTNYDYDLSMMVQKNHDTKFVRSIRRRLDVLPSKSGGAASSQQGPGVATQNSLAQLSGPIIAGGAVPSLHDSGLVGFAAYLTQLRKSPPRQSGVATSPRGVPFGGGRVVHPPGHLTAAAQLSGPMIAGGAVSSLHDHITAALSAIASSKQASIVSSIKAAALLRPVVDTRLWKSLGQKGLEDNKLYKVSSSSREYSGVKNHFMKSMDGKAIITRIERVENGRQHEAYAVLKKNIPEDIQKEKSNLTQKHLVRLAFHGTNQNVIRNIISDNATGYIPVLSGSRTGAIWGPGTYFAVLFVSISPFGSIFNVACLNSLLGEFLAA